MERNAMLHRTYQITSGGDVRVVDHSDGVARDISDQYQNIERDARRTRVEASVDVYVEGEDIRMDPASSPDAAAQSSLDDLSQMVKRDIAAGHFR